MVNDIVRGTFKGFAMLRQIALSTSQPGMPGFGQPQPVYVQGYGFVPPSQVRQGRQTGSGLALDAPGRGNGGMAVDWWPGPRHLAGCWGGAWKLPPHLTAPHPHTSNPTPHPPQVYNPDDPLAAAQMLRSSPPTGPLTPPMTPLRAAGAGGLAGGLTPEALAALLGQQQQPGGGMAGVPGMQGMGGPTGSQGERMLYGQQPGHWHWHGTIGW